MNDLRPGAITLLAGGAVLFISTFLDWRPNTSGVSTDAMGLQGLFCMAIGAAVVLLVGVNAFGGRDLLPHGLVGFTTNQLFLALGFAAFLMTFGLQFARFTEFGVLIGWVSAAAVVVGAILADRETSAASTPPTPF